MATRFAVFSGAYIDNYARFNNDYSRINNCLYAIQDIFEYCNRNNIQYILNGGNMFNRITLHNSIINRTVFLFNILFKKYPNIKILNITGTQENESSIEWLCLIYKDNFFNINNKNITVNGVRIYGLPYYQDNYSFNNIPEESLLLTHKQSISGDFKRILNGYELNYSNNKNLTNIGSLLQKDFNDFDSPPKGFMYYDYITGDTRKIELNYPKFIISETPIEDDYNYIKVKLNYKTTHINNDNLINDYLDSVKQDKNLFNLWN